MGGRRLEVAARVVVIATAPDADADGVLGTEIARVDDLAGAPAGVALLLTGPGVADVDQLVDWFRLQLAGHEGVLDRVALDPGSHLRPAALAGALLGLGRRLAALGRPVAVTLVAERVGTRIGTQALAMASGARLVVTAQPTEARRVADVLDAVATADGCAP